MEMDHNALWAQITLAAKMRLGIDTGSMYRSDDSLMFGIAGRKRQRFKIRLNGRGAGIELNPRYFDDGAADVRAAEAEASAPALFDLLNGEAV